MAAWQHVCALLSAASLISLVLHTRCRSQQFGDLASRCRADVADMTQQFAGSTHAWDFALHKAEVTGAAALNEDMYP